MVCAKPRGHLAEDASRVTFVLSHGLRDPFYAFSWRELQQISRGEFDNLDVILSPGGNTTMIVPVCNQKYWDLFGEIFVSLFYCV